MQKTQTLKQMLGLLAAVAVALPLGGCVGSSLAKKEDVVYMETSVNREMASMRRDIERNNTRIDDVGAEQALKLERMEETIDRLEARLAVLETASVKDADARAALEKELRGAVADGDRKVVKDVDAKIDALLDAVVKENKKIVQQFNRRQNVVSASASSGAQSASSSSDTVRGYYHTIERGQSLSKIAAIYGVSMESILRENEIDDPDKIRAGQQIFIPQEG